MFKRVLGMILALTMIVSLAACGATEETPPASTAEPESAAPEADAEPIVLRMVEQMPEGHVMTDTLTFFAQRIEELSGGSIMTELYTGGQLGDDVATYEAIQSGTAAICRVELTTLVNFGAEKAAVAGLPYIIRDREHFWNMANSDVGQELLDSIQADGTQMVGLALVEEGARHFFTKDPVNSMADLAGMKIRVQNTDMWLAIVEALGASPTPMSFSELYQALQSGVVDGAEQPLSGFMSQKFYEVNQNMILDGHVYPIQAYVFSEQIWETLTDEQKDIILQAAAEAQEFNRDIIESTETEIMGELETLGVTVVEVEDKTEWVEAMAPVYEEFSTPEVTEILGKIQAIE